MEISLSMSPQDQARLSEQVGARGRAEVLHLDQGQLDRSVRRPVDPKSGADAGGSGLQGEVALFCHAGRMFAQRRRPRHGGRAATEPFDRARTHQTSLGGMP